MDILLDALLNDSAKKNTIIVFNSFLYIYIYLIDYTLFAINNIFLFNSFFFLKKNYILIFEYNLCKMYSNF